MSNIVKQFTKLQSDAKAKKAKKAKGKGKGPATSTITATATRSALKQKPNNLFLVHLYT